MKLFSATDLKPLDHIFGECIHTIVGPSTIKIFKATTKRKITPTSKVYAVQYGLTIKYELTCKQAAHWVGEHVFHQLHKSGVDLF